MDLSSFPKLRLNADNQSAAFETWKVQFKISVEMTNLNLGKEKVGHNRLPVFRSRMKLLALLGAVGEDKNIILHSLGFDLDSNGDDVYEEALTLLSDQFIREERCVCSHYEVCDSEPGFWRE